MKQPEDKPGAKEASKRLEDILHNLKNKQSKQGLMNMGGNKGLKMAPKKGQIFRHQGR